MDDSFVQQQDEALLDITEPSDWERQQAIDKANLNTREQGR